MWQSDIEKRLNLLIAFVGVLTVYLFVSAFFEFRGQDKTTKAVYSACHTFEAGDQFCVHGTLKDVEKFLSWIE